MANLCHGWEASLESVSLEEGLEDGRLEDLDDLQLTSSLYFKPLVIYVDR